MTSLTQHVIGRMTALLFMGAGLAAALSPSPAVSSHAGALTVGLCAFVLGAAAWFAPWNRWPRIATLVLMPPAFGLLASSVLLGSYNRSTYALYYLLVFVWIGVSHRRGIALALTPLAAAAYLVPMIVTGRSNEGLTSVWEVIGLSVLVGEGLAWMSTRLRRAEALDRSRVWEMQMLLQAAERLAGESDPARVPHLIASLGQQILRADATAVFLKEDRETLVGLAASQWPSDIDDRVIRIDDDERIANVLRAGEVGVSAAGERLSSVGPTGAGAFHTEVLLPLRGSSAVQGLFVAGYAHDEPQLDAFGEHLARMFATQSALALERRQAVRSLLEESLRDELTGLGNRRAANRAVSALQPSDAVVMIDLDHFKDLNDTQGHAAGDELLRAFATCASATLRDGDVAVRLGGDEFLLILHGAGDHAINTVERLAGRWRETSQGITFSAGIAKRREREDDVVGRADAALYTAKHDGRDRIASEDTLVERRATPA
jgi:diguanylate cyclase (GGDEF)-like protein